MAVVALRAEHDRGRPGERAASKTSANDHPIIALELVVNLDHDHDELAPDFDVFRADRHRVDVLRHIPSGVTVRVFVGRRIMATNDAVSMLRWAAERAHVVFMAETIEAGLAWKTAVDGRAAS